MCRRELGYCSINWSETSGTTIDSFSMFNPTATSAIYGSAAASGSGRVVVKVVFGPQVAMPSSTGARSKVKRVFLVKFQADG